MRQSQPSLLLLSQLPLPTFIPPSLTPQTLFFLSCPFFLRIIFIVAAGGGRWLAIDIPLSPTSSPHKHRRRHLPHSTQTNDDGKNAQLHQTSAHTPPPPPSQTLFGL
ncbi:hypothetical protein IE53DRAFT_389437 [Violaceomyces palustris]|uniref:Uncharacterized protein n=1 Tax=Violaceomyces palustris TaxID=1673888 RepID=A0ACD0NRD0_9BASI|nr:hypothetical protein IE53DRAFT_389437 [Violaceomyces palustris]